MKSVTLRKMSEAEYSAYIDWALPNYAAEKQKAEGHSAQEAKRIAEESYKKLLPQGIHTAGQHFFSIIENENHSKVGILWFAEILSGDRKLAFIYDFEIHEVARRKGYGQAALCLVEDEVRALGIKSLALHVFGNNSQAIALYEKLGYHTTNRNMAKTL